MTEQTVTIVHYPRTISDNFVTDFLSEHKSSTLAFDQVVLDTSRPQASWQEMILHAYVVLGPAFWSAYLSGALSAGTIEILKSAINKIGKTVQGRKLKYLQSDGIKETKINYGFTAHPKKGYSIKFHAEGDITTEALKQAFKHVERINKSQESHLFEIYKIEGKTLKKKQ